MVKAPKDKVGASPLKSLNSNISLRRISFFLEIRSPQSVTNTLIV
jgi:hypothetical protein